jgi:hypothetical protein
MHLRYCKRCKVVFKTAIKHCRTCDSCKVKIIQEVNIERGLNRKKCAELRAIQEEKVKLIQEQIKADPFSFIRM